MDGLLQIFSSIARDPEQFLKLPDEPMASLVNMVPWNIVKDAFMAISSNL
jgi:hypothetical protein